MSRGPYGDPAKLLALRLEEAEEETTTMAADLKIRRDERQRRAKEDEVPGLATKTCSICGAQGHNARGCPKKPQTVPAKLSRESIAKVAPRITVMLRGLPVICEGWEELDELIRRYGSRPA